MSALRHFGYLHFECLRGAGVDAGAAFCAGIVDDRFVVRDNNRIEGAGRNTFTAAGAFIQINFYGHEST